MTDTPLSDDVVETAARAMLSASRPGVNPDELTPAPRGQLGMVPKWKMYEHLARAALEAARYGEMVEALRVSARAFRLLEEVAVANLEHDKARNFIKLGDRCRALLSSIGASQP